MLTQVTNALQKSLGDEEKLLAEVQRDRDRYQQRKDLEDQVHGCDWLRSPSHLYMSMPALWQNICVEMFAGAMIKRWSDSDCYNMHMCLRLLRSICLNNAPKCASWLSLQCTTSAPVQRGTQNLLCAGNIDGTQSGLAGGRAGYCASR